MCCVMNFFFTATPVHPTSTIKLKSQKTPKRNYLLKINQKSQNEVCHCSKYLRGRTITHNELSMCQIIFFCPRKRLQNGKLMLFRFHF